MLSSSEIMEEVMEAYTERMTMSNRMRLMEPLKSAPSLSDSTGHDATPGEADMDRLVCSNARRSFASARLSWT